MAVEVFFTDMRTNRGQSLLDKFEMLLDRAGMQGIIKTGDLTAIKLHFGEKGNTAFIRPQFLRRVVDRVKDLGGKPFLTDANTLYVGARANAVDHLNTAIENGFAYAVVGAPLIIADGLTGKDYVQVEIEKKHFKDVKIASAAVYADAFIAVTHFKGHEATGFGGTLKNIGMGLGSRSGKQMMHSDVLPEVDPEKCTGCARCTNWCPADAIYIMEQKATIPEDSCIGCGECTVTCPNLAIAINWKTNPDVIQEKIAEYTYGVLKDKQGKAIFISFVTGVTPDCDCCGWSDAPIVSDIGILASKDPIALDQACVDLVNTHKGLENSRLEGYTGSDDKFGVLHPGVDWRIQLSYGEEIGLGTRKYSLVKV